MDEEESLPKVEEKKMTDLQKRMNKVIKAIAALEGKKKNVAVGDIREVLKCMAVYEAACIIKTIKTLESEDSLAAMSLDEVMSKYQNINGEVTQLLMYYRDKYLEKGLARL